MLRGEEELLFDRGLRGPKLCCVKQKGTVSGVIPQTQQNRRRESVLGKGCEKVARPQNLGNSIVTDRVINRI